MASRILMVCKCLNVYYDYLIACVFSRSEMPLRLLLLIFTTLSCIVSVFGQTTLTLQPSSSAGKDAILSNVGSNESLNFGNSIDNQLLVLNGWSIQKALIEFDLSSIPSGAIITEARLSLFHDPTPAGWGLDQHFGQNGLVIERVTSAWEENTVTWDNQPSTTPQGLALVPESTSGTQDYLDINVSQMVSDMITDPAGNNGFLLRIVQDNSYANIIIASSDHNDASRHPKLVVTYQTEEPITTEEENFARVAEIHHACGGSNGSILMEIIPQAVQDYYYIWTHTGTTTLFVEDLAPGLYTFYIESIYGCKEEYKIEILDLNNCTSEYNTRYNDEDCSLTIGVNLLNSLGEYIDPSQVSINWTIEGQANQTGALISLDMTNFETIDFCYSYEIMNGNGGSCCSETVCSQFRKPENAPSCQITPSECLVVINEMVRGDKQRHYIELLVVGDGKCGQVCDLRGMILDDNNGEIMESSVVDVSNIFELGVNLGFVRFPHIDNWASVPVGSLILIYNPKWDPGAPQEDPTDANNDFVYILSGDNNNYLKGYLSEWNDQEKKYDYNGFPTISEWEKISISPGLEGMQVRSNNGELKHALAIGDNTIVESTGSGVIAGYPEYSEYVNCSLVGLAYLNPSSYTCQDWNSGTYDTPGYKNSEENGSLIDDLRNCSGAALSGYETKSKQFDFVLHPNPTASEVNVEIASSQPGYGIIRLFNTNGKKILEQAVELKGMKTSFRLTNTFSKLPSGMYLVQLSSPTGETVNKKLIKIK